MCEWLSCTLSRIILLQYHIWNAVATDPYVHKPGEGPSSADLTGEHSDDDTISRSKDKKKKKEENAAKSPSASQPGTPSQRQVNRTRDAAVEKGKNAY